jgi:hypothetical protein
LWPIWFAMAEIDAGNQTRRSRRSLRWAAVGAALWLSTDPLGAQHGGLQPGEAPVTRFSSVPQRPTAFAMAFALGPARPTAEASPLLMLAAGALEVDIDRPGMDYQNFDLPAPDPAPCRAACEKDGRCRAFTYVKPGNQGPNARCWLKTAIPEPRPNACCISGIKEGSVAEPLAPPPPRPGPPPPPPAISPIRGAWQLTSTCEKWLPGNETWRSILILFEAADGSLSGSAVNDRLRSELKPDSTDYGPPVKSRRSENSITLVIHPAGWKSVLVLNGRFDGSSVAGTIHHEGTDDCSFHMVRGG